MLQQWYNLSDPQLEEVLGDRLSFRRFVGLGLQDDSPDHSTISRLRSALGEARSAQLFRELGQQLQARGMIVKPGTLLDAILVVDQQSGLMRQAVFTAAKVYEWLQARGIKDRIAYRAHKYQRALPHWQQRRNALIDPVRQAVENVFGTLKRSYGYRRVRYRGLARNAVEMWLKVMAYNLRRADRMAVSGS